MRLAQFVPISAVILAGACSGQLRLGGEDGGSNGTASGGSNGTASGGSNSIANGGSNSIASGGRNSTATGGWNSDVTGLPCDVLEQTGRACVSAHSTVRALRTAYSGPLYRVMSSDGTSRDIGIVDGYADATSQDTFCAGSVCTVSVIYDQSGLGNDLTPSPPGGGKRTRGNPANAAELAVAINGHSAYGLKFQPGMGYRKLVGYGTPRGDEPETIYMVSSARDLVNGCCFDYGNAETTANDDGNGTAEAVYFGMGVGWGSGVGEGPWVMADLENGLFPGWENGQWNHISTNTPLPYDFVTAVLVGDTADQNGGKGRFALYGGDATVGTLTTMYDGIRPEMAGYVPMKKQGSIILSTAGDNSDSDGGRFYEGAVANGAATYEIVQALQASIVAARYGQ